MFNTSEDIIHFKNMINKMNQNCNNNGSIKNFSSTSITSVKTEKGQLRDLKIRELLTVKYRLIEIKSNESLEGRNIKYGVLSTDDFKEIAKIPENCISRVFIYNGEKYFFDNETKNIFYHNKPLYKNTEKIKDFNQIIYSDKKKNLNFVYKFGQNKEIDGAFQTTKETKFLPNKECIIYNINKTIQNGKLVEEEICIPENKNIFLEVKQNYNIERLIEQMVKGMNIFVGLTDEFNINNSFYLGIKNLDNKFNKTEFLKKIDCFKTLKEKFNIFIILIKNNNLFGVNLDNFNIGNEINKLSEKYDERIKKLEEDNKKIKEDIHKIKEDIKKIKEDNKKINEKLDEVINLLKENLLKRKRKRPSEKDDEDKDE